MRGYVPQYELAARLIYEAMASGKLRWVGLADRSAGDCDDIVLGLQDRIVGHQIKTKRDPEAFGLRTLLLGADQLLQRLVSSWKELRAEHAVLPVQVTYASDNFPRTTDNLSSDGRTQASSAAFLRAHNAHSKGWSLDEWTASPFGKFFSELIEASGLSSESFLEFWRNVVFLTGGAGRQAGLGTATAYDERRLQDLFALLPKLVADESDKDRWSAEELLRRLKWRDPFRLRHDHVFPTDSLVQSNGITENAIRSAFEQHSSGYISLLGPPGSGKSTLLQLGLLATPRAIFMRYLAFVPDEGHGLGRAEAGDFLHDLICQFKKQGLGESIVPGSELPELRQQLGELLRSAGGRYKADGVRTIIVVDGLDHIPREERPDRSLLCELPQPSVIPAGVIFLLGTQRLDLNDIPPAVSDQAASKSRRIDIAPLSREAVHRLADFARVPTDVERDVLWQLSEGHPLSLRYLIEGLIKCESEHERKTWLSDGSAFGRNVDAFYERAWHDLKNEPQAREVLAYIALAEGSLDPVLLDEVVGSSATDAAWRAAAHLLRRNRFGRWAIFHNSFRLFLIERTALRFDRRDEDAIRQRYRELAELAKRVSGSDPQRWLELRYCARAGDHESVLQLAVPTLFRLQFADGRNPGEIQNDIRLSFSAARILRNSEKLFELILCRNEIEMRSDAIGVDALIDAYIAADEVDAAIGLVEASGVSLPVTASYRVVDALLQQGRADDAKSLFEQIEPIDKLLGSENLDLAITGDEDLYCWARRVLIFRDVKQFLAALDNVRLEDGRFHRSRDVASFKRALRLLAARTEIESSPNCDLGALAEKLQIEPASLTDLRIVAAQIAYEGGLDEVARAHLREASAQVKELGENDRRRAANMLLVLGEPEFARKYFSELKAPNLDRGSLDHSDWLVGAAQAILLHASIEVQLNENLSVRHYPPKSLLKALQLRLEALGRLAGAARSGNKRGPDAVWQEVKPMITLLQRGEGEHHYERWELDQALPQIGRSLISIASLHSKEAGALVIERIDDILNTDPGPLGAPQVRRSFARAAFDQEKDTTKAMQRLQPAVPTGEEYTPNEYVEEIAHTAKAFADFGEIGEARQLLRQMHEGTLGISRPAKKDAQYIMWREIFQRACDEDACHREQRVRFLARLLDGLSHTEGKQAGWRVTSDLLVEAYQCAPSLAVSVANQMVEAGLAPWTKLLSAALKGVSRCRPDLACAAAYVFDRLALPFMDDESNSIFDDLVTVAPAGQRETIIQHAAACVAVDADAALRFSLLRQIDQLARKYNLERPAKELVRWQEESIPTRAGAEENPYAAANSLAELEVALSSREVDSQRYHAIRKYAELAKDADYVEVKAFMTRPEFLEDQSALTAAARAAIAAGCREDAHLYAEKLRVRAGIDGSWGHWQSGAKHKLHQILVELEGEPARVRAFEAFANDMSRGREWTGSLLPDLVEIFELFSPRPSWSAMWDALAAHLALFRDYRLGRDVVLMGFETEREALISDLLFQAVDLMATEVARQVRLTAIELVDVSGGPKIVLALLSRLVSQGGERALEAARIAWEVRHSPEFALHLEEWLSQWIESDDLALFNYANCLAHEFGYSWELRDQSLPGFYRLSFPEGHIATEFDPPTGFDPTNPGLWTEDPFTWTWPLETPLKILTDATEFDLSLLRRRAAQVMRQNGGRSDFGPEIVAAQQANLRRLDLRIIHRRLPVVAAFRAIRQVAAELLLANELDVRRIPIFLSKSGTPDIHIATMAPQPRPMSIIRPVMSSAYMSREVRDWLGAVDDAPYFPAEPGWNVIASACSFERTSIRRELVEEHLLPTSDDLAADDLHGGLWKMPQIAVLQGLFPIYEGYAAGAIASVRADIAASVPDRAIMLCPRVARTVGLRPDPSDLFSFVDEDGLPAVRSIWWRDGGICRRDTDTRVHGEGFIVVATDATVARLKPFLGQQSRMQVWRTASVEDMPGKTETRQAVRVVTMRDCA
jgi:hypothetical protein